MTDTGDQRGSNTTDPTDIKSLRRKHYEQTYAQKF